MMNKSGQKLLETSKKENLVIFNTQFNFKQCHRTADIRIIKLQQESISK